jgi:anti-anti-sigma factor
MAIDFDDISDSLRVVSVTGRMDIPGTEEISLQLATLTATSGKHIVLDLTDVSFLASIGIRSLIINAKACHQRGGKMVLFVGENEQVTHTLEATGIGAMIPMFSNREEAIQAASV